MGGKKAALSAEALELLLSGQDAGLDLERHGNRRVYPGNIRVDCLDARSHFGDSRRFLGHGLDAELGDDSGVEVVEPVEELETRVAERAKGT